MSTTNLIKATRSGPITLDLTLVAGLIQVVVADGTYAQIELSTDEDSGLAADAVNKPVIAHRGDCLSIDASIRGGVVQGAVYGNVQVNNFGGVRIGGVNYGGIQVGGGSVVSQNSSPITARALLPIGSSLIADATSAPIQVRGPLNRAKVRTTNGRIELDIVRDLDVETISGSIAVVELAGDGRAETVSGSITVERGGPYRLIAETVSGNITAPNPIRLDGRTVSGRVRNY
ncbi:hypothetical protein [Micromonospora maritima]|nr:hypothetical protein [Micromonospora maritima]